MQPLQSMGDMERKQTISSLKEWWKEISPGANETSFILLHVNIRSLKKHYSEMNLLLDPFMNSIDCLVISETNIKDCDEALFQNKSFETITNNRKNKRGGGIMVMVNKKWNIKNSKKITFSRAEAVQIDIENEKEQIQILAVYRAPQGNIAEFIDDIDNWIKVENSKNLIITGDINIDITKQSNLVDKYLNCLAEHGLQSMIKDITREEILGLQLTRSCIDHICIRSKKYCKAHVIAEKLADHYFVGIAIPELGIPESERDQVTTYINNTKVDKYVREINWESIANEEDPEIIYNKIKNAFTDIYKKSSEQVTVKKRKTGNQWVTKEIDQLIRKKNKAWRLLKSSPESSQRKEEYRSIRNKVTSIIKKEKRNYFWKKFEDTKDPTQCWSVINQVLGRNTRLSIDQTIKKNFGTYCNDEKIANDFNNEFIQSIELLCNHGYQKETENRARIGNSMYLPEMTEEDLVEIVSNMKTNKAVGIDSIRPRDIKENVNIIKTVLLALYNKSLAIGKVPSGLKTAVVRPIYKKGDKKTLLNYRPVCILPVLNYIMEKYVHKALNGFINKYNLLTKTQYGFKTNSSTITLLEDFSDFVNKKLDEGNYVLALFIDFSRAFETVRHETLIDRLFSLGVRGQLLDWFKDYLSGRTQVVKIASSFSEKRLVKQGVPQGTVLGPILFNIYINDIVNVHLNSVLFQFADDTVILYADKDYTTAENKIQEDVYKLVKWYKENQIIINTKKTELMCFRSPQRRTQMEGNIKIHSDSCKNCNCEPLKLTTSVKYLGLYIDEHLKWNQHVEHICKRLRSVAAQLYHLRSCLPQPILKMIYHSLGKSVLVYGITIYGHCAKYLQDKINSILNKVVKNLYVDENRPLHYMYQQLDIQKLSDLLELNIIIQHQFSDKYKTKYIPIRNLRPKNLFQEPKVKTKYGKAVRASYVPRVFNKLPPRIIEITKISELKRELKQWFINRKELQ